VRKLPSGRWQARYHDTDGERRPLGSYATEREAQDALARARAERADGLPYVANTYTLRSWLTEYVETIAAPPAVRPQTQVGYRVIARRWSRDRVGSIRLTELSPGHVRAALLRFADTGLSARTVRQHHSFLRSVLRAAIADGHLRQNVADRGKLPRVESRRELPHPADLARVRAAIDADELRAFWLLGLTAGLRLGEICGLRWGDVDLVTGTWSVRRQIVADGRVTDPKSRHSARGPLPLPPAALAALRELRAATFPAGVTPLPSTWIFAGPRGKPRAHRVMQERWTALQRRAGVKPMPFHITRHQAAHDLLARFPMVSVSKYLGHASIAITVDLYGHTDASAIRWDVPPAIQDRGAV
jgi:integrase